MAVPACWALLNRPQWMPMLCLLLLVEVPCPACGQGLRPDLDALVRSGTTFATFRQVYRASTAWRNAMRTSKRSACSSDRGNLCGSTSEQAELLLATSPQKYDARDKFSDVAVVGPVKNQGDCGMCVAFAVLAAAQTAAAVALRQSFSSPTLSEQDFFVCRTEDQLLERSCSSGWNVREGMLAFVKLQRSKQLPVVEACRPYEPFSGAPCIRFCNTTLPQLLQGEYKIKELGSIVEMQRHIRQHGSLVCRMQLYSDVKPFYQNNPFGIYKGPGTGARMEDAHAVQVVGYDNNRQAWLIKNSWGRRFAFEGFATVAYDAPGMCDVRDTYGFVFVPSQRRPIDLPRLSPAPGRKGCYTYRAVEGDYPEGLASQMGIPVQRLLLDNLNVIDDPSTLQAGTTLLLCSLSSGVASVKGDAAGGGVQDEMAALLAIKRVLDPPGTSLIDWQPGSPSPCTWIGLECDTGEQRVTYINFLDAAGKRNVKLSGQLPSAALLRRLPALVYISMSSTGVGGPLPDDWSQLKQLEEIQLFYNNLTGTLPPSWGALTKLRRLNLLSNTLSGPLPSAWSGMGALVSLDVSMNRLTGRLPPSWSALTKLRTCWLFNNTLSGPLPGAWSGMAALLALDLMSNRLTGPLPPSWGALTKLRACRLFNNTLSGPLPGAWSGMAELEEVYLDNNALTGTVPSSWGSWGRVKVVTLFANPKLSGCLPVAWRGKVLKSTMTVAGLYKSQDRLTAGTGITGFC